ncbi:MAG: recombinase family protein [Deltaproteobacteria bacterium]|nr:recombinase family protein [Deltaproteobacteria bacterium]
MSFLTTTFIIFLIWQVISRSTKDFCNLLELFDKFKCKILSLREQFDTTTAAGEMMLNMLMNFAQFERKQLAERVQANVNARAKRGLYNGGPLPLGIH